MPSGKKNQQKRGLPIRTGKRKAKIAGYFEMVYPFRKLLRMHRNGATIKELKAWAFNYKAPSGLTGAGILIKFGKAYDLNVNQVD